VVDPGCDYHESMDSERCGKTPTQPLAIGTTAPPPGYQPDNVELMMVEPEYAHYCDEHLSIMQAKFGQK
jgi:hypothetical protein